MSDRTCFQVRFARPLTPDELLAVAAFGEEWGVEVEEELDGTTALHDYEARVGFTYDERKDELIAIGVPFSAWEDPAYEYLGDLLLWTPELGEYRAACDAEGNPVWSEAEIRKALEAGDVEALFPTRWESTLAALRPPPPVCVVGSCALGPWSRHGDVALCHVHHDVALDQLGPAAECAPPAAWLLAAGLFPPPTEPTTPG